MCSITRLMQEHDGCISARIAVIFTGALYGAGRPARSAQVSRVRTIWGCTIS